MTRAKPLRLVGYWRSDNEPHWPDPLPLVDPSWDEEQRFWVASYLKHGFVARMYLGKSRCRVCGEWNGSLELSDGAYLWPEGLAHYVYEHAVRLPPEFLEHISVERSRLEARTVDTAWWAGQYPPDSQ